MVDKKGQMITPEQLLDRFEDSVRNDEWVWCSKPNYRSSIILDYKKCKQQLLELLKKGTHVPQTTTPKS